MNSLINHERLCQLNPNRQLTRYEKYGLQGFDKSGKPSWNKGLTKETDERVAASGRTYSKHYADGKISPNHYSHSCETKM